MVYSNQEEYYNAIQESTDKADSFPFIEFMLFEILKTLQNKNIIRRVGSNKGGHWEVTKEK